MEQGLPKAIQEQLEQAEAIEKQLAEEQKASKEGNTEAPPPEPQQPPEPTEVNTEPQQAEQKPAVEEDNRYKILQGKYNAEVPKLHEQIKQQSETMQSLQKELEALKQKAQEPQQPKQSLVTKEDEDTFGSDLVDMARRVAREEGDNTAHRIAVLEQAINQLLALNNKVSAVEKVQAQTAEERFWTSLDTAVPDWKEINANEKWITWLAEYDVVAGRTRQESLDEASASLDSNRVVGLFNIWKANYATPQEPAKSKADKELSRQVAPPKQGASTQPVSEKIWSFDEYSKAFDPRLHVSMSEQDIEALQADADKALAEGRVR